MQTNHKYKIFSIIIFLCIFWLAAADEPYEHDKYLYLLRSKPDGSKNADIYRKYQAFTVIFDGPDDDNGDGVSDLWRIPEVVCYEIRRKTKLHHLKKRPKWTTDAALFKAGIAPSDSTYAVSGTSKLKVVKLSSRFVRGHLCPKSTAERISESAALETFTLLNAVPMLQATNNGPWKQLENHCNDLADKYGRIWIMTGPIFFNNTPSMWLGSNTELQAAIPDAFFKVIVIPAGSTITTESYVIPNILAKPQL